MPAKPYLPCSRPAVVAYPLSLLEGVAEDSVHRACGWGGSGGESPQCSASVNGVCGCHYLHEGFVGSLLLHMPRILPLSLQSPHTVLCLCVLQSSRRSGLSSGLPWYAIVIWPRRMLCRRCRLGGRFAANVASVSPPMADSLLLSVGLPVSSGGCFAVVLS